MKKHLITATFAVAIVAMAGYNTYLSHVDDGMSDMVLENVEALANDTENSEGDKYVYVVYPEPGSPGYGNVACLCSVPGGTNSCC